MITQAKNYFLFLKKVNDIGWTLKKKLNVVGLKIKWIISNIFGRDMETLLAK